MRHTIFFVALLALSGCAVVKTTAAVVGATSSVVGAGASVVQMIP